VTLRKDCTGACRAAPNAGMHVHPCCGPGSEGWPQVSEGNPHGMVASIRWSILDHMDARLSAEGQSALGADEATALIITETRAESLGLPPPRLTGFSRKPDKIIFRQVPCRRPVSRIS
jgi:hypothetical protein